MHSVHRTYTENQFVYLLLSLLLNIEFKVERRILLEVIGPELQSIYDDRQIEVTDFFYRFMCIFMYWCYSTSLLTVCGAVVFLSIGASTRVRINTQTVTEKKWNI